MCVMSPLCFPPEICNNLNVTLKSDEPVKIISQLHCNNPRVATREVFRLPFCLFWLNARFSQGRIWDIRAPYFPQVLCTFVWESEIGSQISGLTKGRKECGSQMRFLKDNPGRHLTRHKLAFSISLQPLQMITNKNTSLFQL